MEGLSYVFFTGYAAFVFFGFVTASVLTTAFVGAICRRVTELTVDSGKNSPKWISLFDWRTPSLKKLRFFAWCFALPAAATYGWFYRSASETAQEEVSFAAIVGVKQPASAKINHIGRVGTFDTTYWISSTCNPSDLYQFWTMANMAEAKNLSAQNTICT